MHLGNRLLMLNVCYSAQIQSIQHLLSRTTSVKLTTHLILEDIMLSSVTQ